MTATRSTGFSLVETLVVTSIVGLLMGITLPALSRAREQAKVVAVNAELRQIGLCLDLYMEGNQGRHPPTRKDCSLGWDDHQLPPELVTGGYLPKPATEWGMSTGIQDRFNPGHTYRYAAVGELVQNGVRIPEIRSELWVPKGFPDSEGPADQDIAFDDPASSPVTWAVYSQGPKFDAWTLLKQQHGPVAKRTWYDPAQRSGLVVRLRLKNGRQIGSFEGR